MNFHLGFELPEPVSKELDHENPLLTQEERNILRSQIRKNSVLIHQYVMRLDLLVNKEKYPRDADFLSQIRHDLALLMAENDTFRKVLWSYEQNAEKNRRKAR